jgi:hypothetical protein
MEVLNTPQLVTIFTDKIKNGGLIMSIKRKYQRKINAEIREWNKILREDKLFQNRFSLRQIDRSYGYDKEYWDAMYLIEIKDSKTNKESFKLIDNYGYRRNLWNFINDFIVDRRKEEGW